MADSTADFTRKILVDVELKSEQIKKDLPALTDTLAKYNAELALLKATQKDLDKSGDQNSTTYRNNTRDIVETTQAIRQLKGDIRDANKYIDNASKAIYAQTGSIQQNRAVLSLVTSDYVKLGQAEGQTDAATTKLAVDVNNLTDRLKEQEKEIGQTYRNVGNYTDSINKSILANGKASQGLQTFQSGISEVRKGMGFLPQLVGGATAQLGTLGTVGTTAFNVLSKSVSGFNVVIKAHNDLQTELTAKEIVAIEAENALAVATELNAKAQEDAALGLITRTEAEAAAVAVSEADTVATLALAEATTASTAATGAGTLALNIFKIALASTGVGLLIVALASLIAYFTDTNEGAKKLQVVFSEIGAIVDTIVKQIAPLGKAIFDVFTQSAGPIKLVAGLLGQAVLPLATIVKLIGDLKNGDFKQAFLDAADAAKQFGTNLKNVAVGSVETVVDLSKAVAKASGDIKINTDDLKANAAQAGALTVQRQTLTKAERLWSEEKIKQQGILDVLKLKIRDVSTTENARIQAAKDAKAVSDNIYANDLKNAQQSLKIIQGQQALKSKVDFQAITDAKNRITQLTNSHNSEIQSIQNRQARVEKIQDKAAITEAQALLKSEQLRKDSLTRQLQAVYDDYGDRVLAADQQYSKELTQLKSYLIAKKITHAEYNSVEKQLTIEHNAVIAKIMDDFRTQDHDKYQAASNELRNLQINAIQEDTARSIASLQERGVEQNQELDKQNAIHLKNIASLQVEIADLRAKGYTKEAAFAEERMANEQDLIITNGKKRVLNTQLTQDAIDKINKKALDDQNKLKDSNDVTAAVKTNGANSSEALAARQKQLLDNYNAEVSNESLTAAAKLEIERKYLADKAALDQADRQVKIDQAVQMEQTIQSGVVDIISQNQQQNSANRLKYLDDAKNQELANTALTNTQKQLINNKYTALENQEKLKAFKANQKLQVANALINGAVAITKTIAEMGFLPAIPFVALTAATTAFSVAKILGQKPAFATGGVFESDGRGAVLPGYSKTDNTNAKLRSGEGIVVSEAMRAPWARNIVSDINVAFGGRSFSSPGHQKAFATGGIFTDGGNANRFYSQPVVDAGTLANTLAYQLINNFPPVMVDVKDINNQQGILAATQNRVIL